MYLPPALLFLLSAQVAPAAHAFAPHRSISHATERLHTFAKRHSARLARDLRVTFQGLSADQAEFNLNASRKVYCVRPDDLSVGLGGNATSTSPATRSGTATSSGSRPTTTSPWKLVEKHAGSNFFDGFSFWDFDDPTHGTVDYQSQSDAQSGGLIEINDDGNVVLRVDTTSKISGNRKSVRITTENSFTGGIFVLDAVHMPQGCGVWPAFWSNGPDWPTFGEIDIVEGVSDYTNNQATLHTASGCSIPSNSTSKSLGISSTLLGGTDCAALETGNQGCGIRSNSNTTFGSGFNSIGGGVYALAWDDDEIAIYFFPQGSVPQDLLDETPLPDTWGTPMARWPASQCDMDKFFLNHTIIINTTLCGDWAGSVWSSSGIPGQESSCATRTGYSTCEDFVRNSGASFGKAYWEISSMKVYQTSRQS